jgi:hypothetical protein
MRKLLLVTLGLVAILLAISACGASPTPVPTLPPPPTLPLRPTSTPQPTAVPQPSATSIPPTAAPKATATTLPPTASAGQPTLTPTTAAPAATVIPATATTAPPSASPTVAIPPGLYVTSLRLDPPQPAHNQTIAMGVTFLNTAGGDQNVKWVVYVFRAENPTRPNTQSPVNPASFKTGPTAELDSLIRFKLGATGNACDFFFARVDILDINNRGTDLPGIDGKLFEKGFSICQ